MRDLRERLAAMGEQLDVRFGPEQFDAMAAATRDSLVAYGLDPSDRAVLEACLANTWQCLSHVVACSFMVGQSTLLLWAQAETYRRMLDGELPILSASDLLHLPGV